jgi:hypothetical protein
VSGADRSQAKRRGHLVRARRGSQGPPDREKPCARKPWMVVCEERHLLPRLWLEGQKRDGSKISLGKNAYIFIKYEVLKNNKHCFLFMILFLLILQCYHFNLLSIQV